MEEKGAGLKKANKTKGKVNEDKEGGEEERARPSEAQSAERGSESGNSSASRQRRRHQHKEGSQAMAEDISLA